MFKKIQGIYVIRNIINEHSYVGQSINIKQRWYYHKTQPKKSYDYPIYRAFRKYGIDNFEFKVLEFVDNIDDLTNREQFWYDKLKPTYNQIEPTKPISSNQQRPVFQIDIDTLNIIKRFESSAEAERETGINSSSISKLCKGTGKTMGGYYWCYCKKYDNFKPSLFYRRKEVQQIDKDTLEVINVFKSINEVTEKLKINCDNIIKVCRGNKHRPTAGGYKWQFVKGDDVIE